MMSLEELIEKTRYDTGITTEEIVQGIRDIFLNNVLESTKSGKTMEIMQDMVRAMLNPTDLKFKEKD